MTEDKTIKGNLYGVPVTATIKGKPDYTPTTEDIRAGWEYATAVIGDEGTAQFDRWLAEVKAEAWEEGCRWGAVEFQTLEAKLEDEDKVQVTDADNPYRGANK